SGAGIGRVMSHLPLKKRELSIRQGDGDEDSDGSKTNSPKYVEGDRPSELVSSSPPDTPPSQYASSYSNYPSSMSHMAPALEDPSMSPSQDVSNSSLPSTSSRHEVPENLESFFPEDILSLVEKKASSSGSDAKPKKKERVFAYFIKGQPVNKLGKKLMNSSTRSRHGSNSSAGPSHVTRSNVAETLDIAQYGAVPSSPVLPPQISSDFYPRAPSYGHGCERPSIHESLFPTTALLQMPHHPQFPPPSHFSGAVGVFPGMRPAGDLDDSSQPSTSGGAKKKKPQQCRYCANHDLYEPVKGHKYSCGFRNCSCEQCEVTRNRQNAVRLQAKQTRQQEALRQQQQQQRQHHLNAQQFGVVDPLMHSEMVRDLDLHDPRSRSHDEDDEDD
ncbi:DM DNA-binding domain, partial [Trinorchestia longiramus]